MLFPDAFAAALSDRTTALAAAFIIATRHADVLQFVARTLGGDALEPEPHSRKANGATRRGRKASGHRKPRASGGDSRLSARDEADQALVKAMRSNPDGSIGDWSKTIHKSRTSTVSALHRLRDAGLAESAEGKWRLCEEPASRAPSAKWIEPVSAAREHRAHASA
jgi:hypothetical protein